MHRAITQRRVAKAGVIEARRGVSLVGILVVIAVIGVVGILVFVLLLATLFNQLETAHGVSCKSNMKQVATAMTNHETDYKVYPVGADPLTGHTGFTHLLQYLGLPIAYDAFEKVGFDKVITGDDFSQISAATAQIYGCPSDPASQGQNYSNGGNEFGRSNYVMCFGSSATWGGTETNAAHKGIWRVGSRSSRRNCRPLGRRRRWRQWLHALQAPDDWSAKVRRPARLWQTD